MTVHQRISNNIKAEIARKGLKLKDVAIMSNINQRSYSNRLENFSKGKDIKFSFFEKTAKVLDIDISIFFA